MKTGILFVLLCISSAQYSQWYSHASGTNYTLKAVVFTDENTGYICGYGTILKTTNGGINWLSSSLPGSHNSMVFVNSLTGFVCSDSGKIYKTTNASANWSLQISNTTNPLASISFINPTTGIAAGVMKTLLKTTDGGNNWFSISNTAPQVDFLSSTMNDAMNYFVTGTDSYIIRTTDGGANWVTFTAGEPNPFVAVEFVNENTGYVTGCCGMFMSTTNKGVDWFDNYFLSLGFTFRDLEFINSNTGYAIGDNGMVYRTINGGLWWDSTATGTNQILYSIYMVNNNTGWVVGNYGTLLKTTNGGGEGFTIGIHDLSTGAPRNFSLQQNYPNPFNPETKLSFTIEAGSKIRTTLNIYDAAGRFVDMLIDKQLGPGKYEVRWNAVKYPSGVYFYTLKRGYELDSKKMILIK